MLNKEACFGSFTFRKKNIIEIVQRAPGSQILPSPDEQFEVASLLCWKNVFKSEGIKFCFYLLMQT
jgi:hypothetical protein